MIKGREFYAETLEEAIEKASVSLGISQEDLKYEVLDPGSSGFLGIGGRDARIEVDERQVSELSGNQDSTADSETVIPEDSEEAEENQQDTETVETPEESPPSSHEQDRGPVPDELLEEVREFVSSATEMMGLDAKVDVYDADDFIAVDVSSAETGLFIGQKGETIDALQYLLNVAIYKDKPFSKRIIIDSEGYRQRRIEAVQGIAHRTARKTVREQRPMELPPMNSSERRTVHTFLKDNPNVETHSQGNGDNRRVVVHPQQ